jgi:cardiolipin synthase C
MEHLRFLWLPILTSCLTGCASFIPGKHYPRVPSTTEAVALETRLGQHFEESARQHPEASGFRLIPVGVDGFLARIEMINAAERTLDLQYYIFRGDETGSLVREALRRAAQRGVHIRVLVDDADTQPGDEDLFDIASEPNIQIRIYNPWMYRGHNGFLRGVEFLARHPRLDYRMHNKLLIVDNSVALAGGRNVGDQYFQIDPQSQFADDDVFTVGADIPELESRFDEFWNSELAIPTAALGRHGHHPRHRPKAHLTDAQLEQAGLRYRDKLNSGEPFASLVSGKTPLVWAHAQVVSDSPDKKKVKNAERAGTLTYPAITEALRNVQREFLMVTPYLVPENTQLSLLHERREQNARVALLTNSLESAPELSAHSGYMHYRPSLLRDGIELYEIRARLDSVRGSGESRRIAKYGNYALHGKLLVFDRKRMYIGSMNFDRRSRNLNTEIGLLIDSSELSEQTAARFAAMTQPESAYQVLLREDEKTHRQKIVWATREQGQPKVYDKEPARFGWARFKAWLLYLLPLDPEL